MDLGAWLEGDYAIEGDKVTDHNRDHEPDAQ